MVKLCWTTFRHLATGLIMQYYITPYSYRYSTISDRNFTAKKFSSRVDRTKIKLMKFYAANNNLTLNIYSYNNSP